MKPIGVFDSGVGGLTVVKELVQQLPGEDIVYFGDTARVPYGIKSKETIIRFSIENILFLLKYDVKLICVACNTVSSLALPSIRSYFKVPIVGVISPAAREAVYATQNKRIGVIGTHGTVKSRTYETEIGQLDPAIKVTAVACPLFVPLVEEGLLCGEVVEKIAQQYLKPLKDAKIDTLILGCTHYPVLKNVIQKEMGPHVRVINSAKQVAIEVKKILSIDGQVCARPHSGKHRFFVSDNPEWFTGLAKTFLGRPITDAKRADHV
jgi:glutamate racemase